MRNLSSSKPVRTRSALVCLGVLLVGLLIGGLNHVYGAVLDSAAERVLGQPNFTSKTANNGGVSAASLAAPEGIAVDVASGRLYVADTGNNRVLSWPSAATFTNGQAADLVIGQPDFVSNTQNAGGGTSAAGLARPTGVAVDGFGNVYVADCYNNRVLEYNTPVTGSTLADRVWGQPNLTSAIPNNGGANGSTSASGLACPSGVAVDTNNNLYVTDNSNHRVIEYDSALVNDAVADHVWGQPNFSANLPGRGAPSPINLWFPVGVALDGSGNLYVADSYNDRVLEYDAPLANDAADHVWGQPDFSTRGNGSTSATTLYQPHSVAVDGNGNLYVADTNQTRVVAYDQALTSDPAADHVVGQPDLNTHSGNEVSALSLDQPVGVAVDNQNNLYIADKGDNRVLGYDTPIANPTPSATPTSTAMLPTGPAFLVKDINPAATQSSAPTNFVAIGNTVYFAADDGVHGSELWRSDGTIAGTTLVKDINGGAGSANPNGFVDVNGVLYFAADDGTHGTELWRSDGSEAGTALVKDIHPSDGSDPHALTNVNGTVFFAANNYASSVELWRSDGTEAGTVLVKDIRVRSAGSSPSSLTNVNGTLFFSADDGTHGAELWRSDGTYAGTVLVKDINTVGNTGSSPSFLLNVNGTLYFAADDGSHGSELWRSDGTEADTVLVKDANTNSQFNGGNSNPLYLTNVNGALFFAADDGIRGSELWRSDGTDVGTVLVKDIGPSGGSDPHALTNVNGTLFFAANNYANGTELWRSDGSETGTVLVRDIQVRSASSNPTGLTNVNGTLFFAADDGSHGNEVWASEGGYVGTVPVQDIAPGAASANPSNFTVAGSTLFFGADDGTHGRELWALPLTDGSTATPTPSSTSSPTPTSITATTPAPGTATTTVTATSSAQTQRNAVFLPLIQR